MSSVYQAMIKLSENRNSAMAGPVTFTTAAERREYVDGPLVFWYHFVEEDDWHTWHRGGAWDATAPEDSQDREVTPPTITEADRW